MLICQISDLHIKTRGKLSYGVVDTSGMLKRCVEHILALKQKPDIVVATGDLTDFGRPDEYAHLRELLSPLAMPLYLIPGNHDHRENMIKAFPDHPYLSQFPPFIQYAIEHHPMRILAIDTVIASASGGELCEKRLAWLAQKLEQAPDRPTIIIMHHPPFKTFIGHMDDIGLNNAEGLKAIVKRHPQITRSLRPPAPADSSALGRYACIHHPQPRASGRARPLCRCAVAICDGAAGLSIAQMAS